MHACMHAPDLYAYKHTLACLDEKHMDVHMYMHIQHVCI